MRKGKAEAAQQAAEAEVEAARIAEGEANPAQPGDSDHAELAEQSTPGLQAHADAGEEDVDRYPLVDVTPEMVQGGDWDTYRPSLTFRAKTMRESFSIVNKGGTLMTGEAGDVVAVIGDDVLVFSGSVFAAEYQPVVHGA